jgi:hypothetical protein
VAVPALHPNGSDRFDKNKTAAIEENLFQNRRHLLIFVKCVGLPPRFFVLKCIIVAVAVPALHSNGSDRFDKNKTAAIEENLSSKTAVIYYFLSNV